MLAGSLARACYELKGNWINWCSIKTGEGQRTSARHGFGQAFIVARQAAEAGQPRQSCARRPSAGAAAQSRAWDPASGSLTTSSWMPWAAAAAAGSSPGVALIHIGQFDASRRSPPAPARANVGHLRALLLVGRRDHAAPASGPSVSTATCTLEPLRRLCPS